MRNSDACELLLAFIEYNGEIEVHNSLLNVVLYDKPEAKDARN